MEKGTISKLTDRGFGFIKMANGKEIFFHHSSLAGAEFNRLQEGQAVEFKIGHGDKGPRAEGVVVTE